METNFTNVFFSAWNFFIDFSSLLIIPSSFGSDRESIQMKVNCPVKDDTETQK